MKFFQFGSFLLTLLLLGACASTTKISPEMLEQELFWTYAHPKSKCFSATVDALKDNKITVKSSNDQSGEIQTDRVPYFTGAVGNAYGAQVITADHQMSLKVTGDAKNCTVATTKYQVWQNRVKVEQIVVPWFRQNVWSPLRETIQQNLDDGSSSSAAKKKQLDI